MKINRKVCRSEIKEADDTELSIVHFISTEEKDRGGDIVRAGGMKINGKPVVMFSHGKGPMGPEPIAKPVWIRPGEHAGKRGILAKTEFFPDETGKRLYQKTKDGFLHSWSIGYTVNPGGQNDIPYKSGGGREITDFDLVEYSLVSVPMNPGAVNVNGDKQIQFKILPADEVGIDDSAQEENGEKEKMPGTDGEPDAGGAGGDAELIKEAEDAVASPDALEVSKGDPDPSTDQVEESTDEDPDIKALVLKIDQLTGMIAALAETIVSSVKQTEPQTEPGEPAPGENECDAGNENPPEAEKAPPPRLVIVQDRPAEPRRLSADALRGLVSNAVNQRLEKEVNRLRGKVP